MLRGIERTDDDETFSLLVKILTRDIKLLDVNFVFASDL
jgi:hypothetical protein